MSTCSFHGIIPRFMTDAILEHYEKEERILAAEKPQGILGETSPEITLTKVDRQRLAISSIMALREERRAMSLISRSPESEAGAAQDEPPPARMGILPPTAAVITPQYSRVDVINKLAVYGPRPPRMVLSTKKPSLTSQDPDANACFKTIKESDKFFRNSFNTPPVTSGKIVAYVHDPKDYNNAAWYQSSQSFSFGDTDVDVFNSMTDSQSIATHELAHAITSNSAGLFYQAQSGALNESFSDVMAIAHQHQVDNVPVLDWTIGRRIMVHQDKTTAPLRSLEFPGRAYQNHWIFGNDPQPAHMNQYQNLPITAKSDWGGVHINSGIPNRAFCEAAKQLGGNTWDKPAKIWFQALQSASRFDQFSDFKKRTVKAAKSLYGSNERDAVLSGWAAVGL